MSEPSQLTPHDLELEKQDAICASCREEMEQVRYRRDRHLAWPAPICRGCERKEREREASEQHEAHLAERVGGLYLPPLYEDTSFRTWELHGSEEEQAKQLNVVKLAQRYVQRWPEVASTTVFIGGPGTGKGHVAWSIVKGVVEYGSVPAVVNLADLIRDIREAWGRPESEPESERLERYRLPDLLVIDEVSRHAFYGQPTQHLYDLINFRVEWLRPTIITTNETTDNLTEMLGPALISRLAGGNMWDFGEHDYRVHGASDGRE